jgi:RHS repeat-associated protein
MPGMTGTYKFHWKRLKGDTAEESGLTIFSQALKYHGDKVRMTNNGNWESIPAGTTSLFNSGWDSYVLAGNLFNPIVLTKIELPTGQGYKFTYDIYGRIERIYYPTGGEERFVYNVIAPLAESEPGNVSDQTNFGVTNRQVYPTANQGTPYQWNYSVGYVAPSGYKVSVTSPDGTISQRLLHRGNSACTGCTIGNFGYDNGLAGMSYEELNYSNAPTPQLVSRKLIHWTKKSFPVTSSNQPADWHPRVDYEESILYDASGNGVSATTRYEFEGDLNQRETPVLVNKTLQYAFVAQASGGNSPISPPDPDPTPVPTPVPPTLLRTTETTYVTGAAYLNQNMVGLATASVVKDGAGTVVARSEMKYDDSGYSPNVGRGNPTTSRVWDSTKGDYDNPNAYIQTRAKFDTYGNQYEAIDGRGNSTTTVYDATYQAFPLSVTTTVPDPSGVNGSNQAFQTSATFDYTTGLPLTTTDANGQTTTIEYDPLTLRPKKVTPPSGAGTSETFYNDQPNNYWVKNKTQIDANKWAESITYFDGLGRAYKSEQVDAQGRVSRVTNPFRLNETKIWTTNVYDEASRIKEIVLPDNSKVITDYGVSATGSQIGETETITDQAGKKIRSITDVFDEVIRVDEPDNNGNLGTIDNPTQATYYNYDTLGEMVKVTQGSQNRFFLYDSLSRLLRVRQPEQNVNTALNTTGNPDNNQWTVGFTYDDNENILTSTDAKGVTVTYGYDNLDRIITRTYSDGTPQVTHKYDNLQYGKGELIEVSNSVSTSKTTSFDNLGRALTYQQITDGQTYISSYQYNLAGALVSETYPSGRQVKYDYNADGDLSRVWGQVGQNQRTYANSFSYTASSAVSSMQLGNGRWETAKFNSRLQVTELGLGNSSADASLWKVNLDYGEIDVNGNLNTAKNSGNIAKQTLTVSGMPNPLVQTYKYDSLDRLTEAKETSGGTQTWIQNFGYDRFGNRTSFYQQIGGLQTTQTPNIDPNTNRFSAGQGYLYDFNGNLVQDAEGRQFAFNGDNKQTQVKDANQNVIGTYFYDGEGKRIKKITNLETTIFVYSAGKLVAEYSTQIPQNPTINYTTTDHLGSPRVITNALGEVVSRRDFMPFGEDLYSGIGGRTESLKYSLSGVDSVRKRFTGYQKDQETGLDFAEARYYNSSHGRFTAVDPLLASGKSDNPQTFNRYAYVMNSPTKLVDPTGLLAASTSACGQCGKGDLFKDLDTFQERLDLFKRTGINLFTKRDMALLQFHVSNGTALGYSFLSAAQRQIRPVPPRRGGRRGGRGGRGATWREGTGSARTRKNPIQSGVNGSILNQNPSNLTDNQISNAFRNTPFEISSHGTWRVRQRVRSYTAPR